MDGCQLPHPELQARPRPRPWHAAVAQPPKRGRRLDRSGGPREPDAEKRELTPRIRRPYWAASRQPQAIQNLLRSREDKKSRTADVEFAAGLFCRNAVTQQPACVFRFMLPICLTSCEPISSMAATIVQSHIN